MKKPSGKALSSILFAVSLMASTGTAAGSPDWRAVGHGGGGNIVDVVTHPTDPEIVWAVTDLTGLFKSGDGGVTFDRVSGPVERQELLYEWMRGLDHELVYDPTSPNILYWAMDGGIYTDPGIYRSTDGGDNWLKIPGSPDLAPGAVAIDGKGKVYGIKHRKLFVSSDRGTTWQSRPDIPTYYCEDDYYWRRKFRVFIYATEDGKVFIGDRRPDSGVFFSSDTGETWTQVLAGQEIADLAVAPNAPHLVMALEQDGRIFRSTNGGLNFTVVDSLSHSYYRWGRWPAFHGGIAINRVGHVMAVGRWEMGISTDEGRTFAKTREDDKAWDPGPYVFPNRQTSKSLFKANKLVASPHPGRWFMAGGHLVKVTEDNGDSWRAGCQGIDILCVYSPPVVDLTDASRIHVVAGDNGHHYSEDHGASWRSSETRMGNADGIAQDPNDPNVWYKLYGARRDRGAIHKSTDGGVTWTKLTNLPMPGLRSRSDKDPSFVEGWIGRLAVDPTESSRIYATHRASDGLYRSEDSGRTFSRVLELERPWELVVTHKGTVFVNTFDSTGLYRSTDRGQRFEKIHPGSVHNFAVHPRDDRIIYVNVGSMQHAWAKARVLPSYQRDREHSDPGKGRLYRTLDGGIHWDLLGDFDGFALYIEPNYPNVLLMATRDGGQGILRSLDGGATWTSFHGTHDNYLPRGFVYGGIPGRVYTWNHNLSRIDDIHKIE